MADRRLIALAVLVAFAATGGVAVRARADTFDALGSALSETKPLVDVRVRSENVDQAGIDSNAEALTLRGRFGFETGQAWSTALLAEGVFLTPLEADYNSTVNGKKQYPTVADPESYGINRLELINNSLPATTLALGRQVIALDDQRFVGNSGWRQLEQTFDAVRLTNRSIQDLTIDLAYLNQINRVYGKSSAVGRYHGDDYLLNVGWQTGIGRLVGFGYLLDLDEASGDSSQTYGLRFTGDRRLGSIGLTYSASYARQHPYAGNTLRYADDYYAAELSGTAGGWRVGSGLEILGGDGVKGFTTPIASLHPFEGWADKFLVTPPNGVNDRYAKLGYVHAALGILDSLSASAAYHDLRSARLDLDYGRELDLLLQARWHRYSALIKYADYVAHQFATSTEKIWAEVDYVW
jgi:hypothetical protein